MQTTTFFAYKELRNTSTQRARILGIPILYQVEIPNYNILEYRRLFLVLCRYVEYENPLKEVFGLPEKDLTISFRPRFPA